MLISPHRGHTRQSDSGAHRGREMLYEHGCAMSELAGYTEDLDN